MIVLENNDALAQLIPEILEDYPVEIDASGAVEPLG